MPLCEEAIRGYGQGSESYHFEIHDRIDSTNRRAKELALAGAEHNTVVLADTQSAGHGRFARPFFSPPGAGIYLSLLLRPALSAEQLSHLTPFAAVAVARAIRRLCGQTPQIKWVNDLFMSGKKVCGILCEAGFSAETGRPAYAIIGIGLNVTATDLPEDLCDIATSIEAACGAVCDRNALIAAILEELSRFEREILAGAYLEEYRSHSLILGKEVTVYRGDEVFAARAVAIDEGGALVIEREGVRQTLYAGEVSIRL